MKKAILFLILIIALTNLAACTASKDKSNEVNLKSITKKVYTVPANKIIESKDGEGKQQSHVARDVLAFLPQGWKPLEQAHGDLNKDSLEDVAIVIEGKGTTESAPPRALIIAFRNKDNSFNLSIRADHAVLKADEGGVWGDPFSGISIDKGTLLISFYGGSNWRWANSYRFRYQDRDWYLIGATESFSHTSTNVGAVEEDYNLLTGFYIKKETGEDGITKTQKLFRGKKQLVKLEDFDIDPDKKRF